MPNVGYEAPLVVFTFTRVQHTKEVLKALSNCIGAKQSKLYIHIDAPRNEGERLKSEQLKDFYQSIKNDFKYVEVVEQKKNLGCDKSMLYMMDFIFKKYSRVIVLEDDDLPHSDFINYMNTMLNKYEKDTSIAGISGYCPPISIHDDYPYSVFKSFRGASWGWATWKENWNSIDWQAKKYNSLKYSFTKRRKFSRGGQDMFPMLLTALERKQFPHWDIVRCFDLFNKNKYFIYPTESLVKNIGFDGTGSNCGITRKYDVNLDNVKFNYELVPDKLETDASILQNFYEFYSYDDQDSYLVTILKRLRLFDTAFLLKNELTKNNIGSQK